eukprot:1968344-Pleurochrysis_carterae.AAC.1
MQKNGVIVTAGPRRMRNVSSGVAMEQEQEKAASTDESSKSLAHDAACVRRVCEKVQKAFAQSGWALTGSAVPKPVHRADGLVCKLLQGFGDAPRRRAAVL